MYDHSNLIAVVDQLHEELESERTLRQESERRLEDAREAAPNSTELAERSKAEMQLMTKGHIGLGIDFGDPTWILAARQMVHCPKEVLGPYVSALASREQMRQAYAPNAGGVLAPLQIYTAVDPLKPSRDFDTIVRREADPRPNRMRIHDIVSQEENAENGGRD